MLINISWGAYFTNSIILPMPYPTISGRPSVIPIYTFFPFTNGHCEEPLPTLLTILEPGERISDKSVDLYPLKLNNMHSCPLTVTTFQNEPYVLIDHSQVGVFQLQGIDGLLMTALSQRMRFSVVVVEDKIRGIVFANRSGTGALGKV